MHLLLSWLCLLILKEVSGIDSFRNVADLYANHPDTLFNRLTPTETYFHKPAHDQHPKCVELVTESVFLPGTCPTHASCSHSVFIKLDATWYGNERGLCIGLGSPPPTKNAKYNIKHNWHSTYQVHFQNLPEDWSCESDSNRYVVLVKDNVYELYSKYQLENWPKYTSGKVDYSSSRYHVLENEVYMTIETDTSYLEPFVVTKNLTELYQKLPIMCTTENKVGKTRKCSYPGRLRLVAEDLCTNECGLDMSCKPTHETIKLPNHFVFNIPGATFLKQFVHWLLYTLLDFIEIAVKYVLDLVHDLLVKINTRYKLVEYTIATLIMLYKIKRPMHAIIIVIFMVATLGITRHNDNI